MKTIVVVNLALISVLVVAGKKFEAIEGQNVTISFDIDEVKKADHARISFKEENKEYFVLLAQKPWVYDDPPDPAVTLILGEGYVSVIIQNISISRSGLYKAETYTREKVYEETATLVVNKAPVSSSPAPPHSSSPNPPSSSDSYSQHWIVIVIFISLGIIVSGGVCFLILRKICEFAAKVDDDDDDDEEEKEETLAVSRSRSSVSPKNNCKNHCSNYVSVAMNGCGENAEVLHPSKNTLTV